MFSHCSVITLLLNLEVKVLKISKNFEILHLHIRTSTGGGPGLVTQWSSVQIPTMPLLGNNHRLILNIL